MIDKERVKKLLGSGLEGQQVALAVGCDPSYISQLVSDESFSAEVLALRMESLQRNTNRDTKIGELEDKVLTRLESAIDNGMIYKPRELLAAFNVINSAKRRGAENPVGGSMTVNQTVVQLNLPKSVMTKFTVTEQGEVIEANGQTLVTMNSHTLLKTLSDNKRRNDSNEDSTNIYDRAGKHIPDIDKSQFPKSYGKAKS